MQQVPSVVWLWLALYCGVCVLAAAKGERDERIIGVTLVIAAAITPFIKDRDWPSVQWAIFADDLVVFAVMLWRALRTPRWWPLFAAAFQMLALCVHGATMADRSIAGWTSITASILLSYGCLAALVGGALNVQLRREMLRRRFRLLVSARAPRSRPPPPPGLQTVVA